MYTTAFNDACSTLPSAICRATAACLPWGYDVSEDTAPHTFAELAKYVAETGRICVWSGGSDATIYGSAAVNYAFRAWHDYHHLKGGYDFTPMGEAKTCLAQIADLVRLYGDNEQTRSWVAIIKAEVIGQGKYLHRHGDFPKDQAAFVRSYIENPGLALA